MRVAAGWMQTRPRVGIDVFVRPAAVAPPREGGHVALMEACLVVLRGGARRSEETPTHRSAIPDLWRFRTYWAAFGRS
ncbi:MAG: hypothetical protein JWQ55_4437 [Rhodopila sp.]|jgi:segregation and condensation protein A|nr:hypothetical protein [Rhodopila sp.]